MKFVVEDQYPEAWISDNEAVSPLPGCERVPWSLVSGIGTPMEGAYYCLEINSLEELIELANKKQCNLFINVSGMKIVFTTDTDME